MKRRLLKRKIQVCYLRGGLLTFVVCLLLASASLAQNVETRITFMSTRSERNSEIFLMNSDGKRVRRLTKHPQFDAEPAWSPDRKKIAFMSFRDKHRRPGEGSTQGEIYVMNPDGTNLINLTQSPEKPDKSPTWSPDGKQIAFISAELSRVDGVFHHDIWVMDADGGNPRNLTNHRASEWGPDWSPDGRQIAFSTTRDRKGAGDKNAEIYVMNADGTNPINITNHPAVDGAPSWGSVRPLGVSSKRKLATLWGKVKRSNTYGGN